MGYLRTLANALTADGLILPSPVRSFLKGKPQPLALDTRERLADWCADHGYSDEQRQSLHNLIRTIVAREQLSPGDRIRIVTHRSRRRRNRAGLRHRARERRQKPGRHRGEADEAGTGRTANAAAAGTGAGAARAQATPSRRWRPGKPIARAPVIEIRKRRQLTRDAIGGPPAAKAIRRRQHCPAAPHIAAVARLLGPPGSEARE